ncbi:MAG: GNAT family N-acetyltransferase, partial [Planctomycetota bacterium]|nr:GNAT family N-acetyltransferase [Planctomycetota bacterium]
EVIELTQHGFVAVQFGDDRLSICVGFSAIEIYSSKLAELQCLAVHPQYQKSGVGKALVAKCVERARELNVMEVMAISSSEQFLQGCGFDYSLPDQKKALFCQLRPRPSE